MNGVERLKLRHASLVLAKLEQMLTYADSGLNRAASGSPDPAAEIETARIQIQESIAEMRCVARTLAEVAKPTQRQEPFSPSFEAQMQSALHNTGLPLAP